MESIVVTDELKAALEHLERSQTFARASGLLRLLRFMVEHSDSSGEGAKEAYIGNVFYGRPGTYDPRYDSVVRVSVKRLRARLVMYYESEGKDDVHRIVVPLGTYGVVLETIELAVDPDPVEAQADGGSGAESESGYASGKANLGAAARSWWTWTTVVGVAVCVAGLITGVWWLALPPAAPPFLARPLSAWPLTPGQDLETDATQSPDGKLLAYVTRPRDSVHFRIFLRPFGAIDQVGTELDTGKGDALRPAWSPDGRTLAFLHCGTGKCDVEIIPAAGGTPRSLREVHTFLRDDQPYFGSRQVPVWSRDGKSVIFSAWDESHKRTALTRFTLATGQLQALTSGEKSDEDVEAAPAPDGHTIAFVRVHVDSSRFMTLDLWTGKERAVLSLRDVHTDGMSWAPNGAGIVASIYDEKQWKPWWIPLRGQPRPISVSLPIVMNPQFRSDGKGLVVTTVNRLQNIVMAPEGVPDAATAKPEVLFRTTQNDDYAKFSPDGARIAFLSNRSGRFELWTAEVSAPGAAKPTSAPVQLTHNLPESKTQSFSWAPDGKSLVIGMHGEAGRLAIVNALDGSWSLLHIKGLETSVLYCPVFSMDGRWIFASAYGLANGIYRIALDGHLPPEQLVAANTYGIQLDGDRALYFDTLGATGVSRIRLDSDGKPGAVKPKVEKLAALDSVLISRKWGIWDGALYYMDFHDDERKLRRFDLRTQKVTAVSGSMRDFAFASPTLSVFPQRHLFLYSLGDENTGSQIVELRPD